MHFKIFFLKHDLNVTAILIVKDGTFNSDFYSILSMKNLHVNVEYAVLSRSFNIP